MPKIKVNKRKLIEQAKLGIPERGNYTFRLQIELMESFKKDCKKQDVKMSAIIEEFLKSYLS